MNGTTRAILRREIEEREGFIGNVDRLRRAGHPEAECHEATARRMRSEVAELRASLGDEPVADHPVGAIDMTHGEALHIHNG